MRSMKLPSSLKPGIWGVVIGAAGKGAGAEHTVVLRGNAVN